MASFRKLPSGKWQATVKHPSGKRHTRTDPLRRVVAEWAADLEQQIRSGDFIDPNDGRQTLATWWTEWTGSRVVQQATTDKRESLWRVHLEPAFGSWPLASIRALDVEKWTADMARRQVGSEAQASAYRLLKQLLGDAVRHRRLRANPCDLVAGPKSPKHVDRFLSVDEADQLLAAITMPGPKKGTARGEARPRVADEPNRVFVRLMLEAGLRWQEAAGLHVFRVDLLRRTLRVQEVAARGQRLKAIPKSNAGARVVPLTDDLAEDVSRQVGRVGRDGLLFPDPVKPEQPLDYSNWLKRVWDRAVADADLADPQPTPHDCRHTYGSWLAEEGVPPHEIAALMGHGSLRAVERYIHASEARLERARAALSGARFSAAGARGAHEDPGRRRDPASGGTGNGV